MVCLLAVHLYVVARVLDLQSRELVVLDFDFLEEDDIWVGFTQPVEQMTQPHLD